MIPQPLAIGQKVLITYAARKDPRWTSDMEDLLGKVGVVRSWSLYGGDRLVVGGLEGSPHCWTLTFASVDLVDPILPLDDGPPLTLPNSSVHESQLPADAVIATGVPGGDCECWCLDVSEEEFRRVAGDEDWRAEKKYGTGKWRLYPHHLIGHRGEKVQITVVTRPVE